MLMENTYASFWQKKCYIFLKSGRRSAKRLCNAINSLHTSSLIFLKTQRLRAILGGIRSLFFQQFSLKFLFLRLTMEFKYKSDYQTQAVSSGLVDFQISYRSFTTATIWVTEDKFFGPGFCLRLMNEEKEEIGTAEFSITSKERTLYGKRARAYSLKRLGPPDMESSLPTISLGILAIPPLELI